MFLLGSGSELCIVLVIGVYYWIFLAGPLFVGVVGATAVLLLLQWRVVVEGSTLSLVGSAVAAHALGLIGPGVIIEEGSFLEDLIFFKTRGQFVGLLEGQLLLL